MAAEVDGRDRRRFPRMRTAWPVILESADGRVGVGQVVDASLSGMRINNDLALRSPCVSLFREIRAGSRSS